MTEAPHISVLRDEVVAALQPCDGGVYIDGTFGAGGYTRAILEAADCTVLAVDRDPDAIVNAAPMVAEFDGRLNLVEGCFSDLADHARAAGYQFVDGVALDVGVSSMQLDQAGRGFSFRFDGPLDMRMAQAGPSAADVVNQADEGLIADILFRYGEEKQSRRIARAIVNAREAQPITTTLALAKIVADALGPKAKAMKIDPATRSFQGLRIYVNDELGELGRALLGAEDILKPGGVLAVVSFHSLEDRLVKQFLAACAQPVGGGSRHLPQMDGPAPSFTVKKKSGIVPTDAETKANPRARSARLRFGVRTDAPAIAPAAVAQAMGPSIHETRYHVADGGMA